jgi:hypothetical protein
VTHPAIRKVDVTVSWVHVVAELLLTCLKAGTNTGRSIGGLTGENLASYTAELGGKVRNGFFRAFQPWFTPLSRRLLWSSMMQTFHRRSTGFLSPHS